MAPVARVARPRLYQSGLAEDANSHVLSIMKKSPCVTFKMLRIAEGDWQIVAECPGMEAPLRPIPVCASRSDSDNLTDLQMFARQTFDRRHNRRARLTVVVFVTDHSTPVRLGTTTTISRFPHELSQEATPTHFHSEKATPVAERACSLRNGALRVFHHWLYTSGSSPFRMERKPWTPGHYVPRIGISQTASSVVNLNDEMLLSQK